MRHWIIYRIKEIKAKASAINTDDIIIERDCFATISLRLFESQWLHMNVRLIDESLTFRF